MTRSKFWMLLLVGLTTFWYVVALVVVAAYF